MKTMLSITTIVVLIFSMSADIFAQTFEQRRADWALNLGSGGANDRDRGYDIAEDAGGNIYITGEFTGTVDFNPKGTATTKVSNGGTDVYIAKYTSAGILMWVETAGSTEATSSVLVDGSPDISTDRGYAIAVNGTNVYVTGYFEGTINFGGSDLTTAGTDRDIFVASFSAAGAHQWSSQYGGTGKDEGLDIAADASGAYVTGSFESTSVTFGGSMLASTATAGDSDIFLAKLAAADGAVTWASDYGASLPDQGRSVTLNGGNVYITGVISGSGTAFHNVSFDVGTTNLTPTGAAMFVATFATTTGVNSDAFMTIGTAPADDVAVGTDILVNGTDIYVTGFTGNLGNNGSMNSSTVNFDPSNGVGASTLTAAANASDIFLAKYTSAAGAFGWAFDVGATGASSGGGLAVRDGGSDQDTIFVTGTFEGVADFKGGNVFTSATGTDMFVAMYTEDGAAGNDAFQVAGRASNAGASILVSSQDFSVYATGFFTGNKVDFDPLAYEALISGASEDAFIVKYNPGIAQEPVPVVPVELTSFTGQAQVTGNLLSWTTATEKQNKGFEIQQRQASNEWTTIGFVEGNGTTLEAQEYSFLDTKAPKGVNYYRLKQVDLDGRYEYSNIVTLESNLSKGKFTVYPTLASDHINIEMEAAAFIQIFNGSGQLLKEQMVDAQQQIDISTLAEGTYFVKMGEAVTRFVIVR